MSTPRFDDRWRAEAHRLVDMIFDHVGTVADGPVVRWAPPAEMDADPAWQIDIGGAEPSRLTELARTLAQGSIQLHHPRYVGHQVCPPFAPAILADLAIATLNQSTAVWEMSPAATTVEKKVIRWLCELAGFPDEAGGTTVSGGSAANLTALMAARARWLRNAENTGRTPVVICSAAAHYSIARAVAILGSGIRIVETPSDAEGRIDVGELALALDSMEGSDESPMAIVATAGSTAMGVFDAIARIADLRDRFRTWLHVDGAHGASVLLAPSLSALVDGIGRADSLSWDPHKMMWMPLSTSVLLVRDRSWLREAFQSDATYLFHRDRGEVDLGAMTIQCSRRADAVRLWLTLNTIGTDPFREGLEIVAATTRKFHSMLDEAEDFEPLHAPDFNILCFRWRPAGVLDADLDAAQERARRNLVESGDAWVSMATIRGMRALRVTIINPATGADDLEAILEAIRRAGARRE